MNVILPTYYYQVLKDGEYVWDDYGWRAYASDLAKYPDYPSDDARRRDPYFVGIIIRA